MLIFRNHIYTFKECIHVVHDRRPEDELIKNRWNRFETHNYTMRDIYTNLLRFSIISNSISTIIILNSYLEKIEGITKDIYEIYNELPGDNYGLIDQLIENKLIGPNHYCIRAIKTNNVALFHHIIEQLVPGQYHFRHADKATHPEIIQGIIDFYVKNDMLIPPSIKAIL